MFRARVSGSEERAPSRIADVTADASDGRPPKDYDCRRRVSGYVRRSVRTVHLHGSEVTWSRRPPDGETRVRPTGPLGRVCAVRRRCVGSTPPSVNDARRVEATGRNHRQTVASPSPNTIDRRSPQWPTRRALSSVRRTFAFARRVRRCRRRSGRIRIRLLPEVGKRRKQSALLARCVTFEDDFLAESVPDRSVRTRIDVTDVQHGLCSAERSVLQSVDDSSSLPPTSINRSVSSNAWCAFESFFCGVALVRQRSFALP